MKHIFKKFILPLILSASIFANGVEKTPIQYSRDTDNAVQLSKICTQIYVSKDASELQNLINTFIQSKNVIDIQYEVSCDMYASGIIYPIYSAIIIYKN